MNHESWLFTTRPKVDGRFFCLETWGVSKDTDTKFNGLMLDVLPKTTAE